jgi:two-component system, OmpR family, sensor histidine kinase VanS
MAAMDRAPGWSVRLKLTLSYTGFVMLAGALLLGAVWLFLLDYIPRGETVIVHNHHMIVAPGRGTIARDFGPSAAIVMTCLLIFGLVGGWILAGRMLAPLTRITEATRTAATGSLSHRIELPGPTDEFRELADAFDTMLARLEAHVAEQRRFAANASHELRTPLAITQTWLDVALQDPDREDDQLLDRLYQLNTRAIDLTEALLLLSRAEQKSFTREPVDLSLLAEEAIETLLPLAEKHGAALQASNEAAPTTGSPTLLLQLTSNLVHNAIIHNRPEGGTVWVTTRAQSDGVVLTVENTGDDLSADVVGTLVEPFQRATERVHTDHAGVGLGLAIVKSIAEAHDGWLSLSPRIGGGLRATVQLPGGGE